MYRLKHSVLDFCYGGVIYYKNPFFCWTVKTLFLVLNQCILRRYNKTSKKKICYGFIVIQDVGWNFDSNRSNTV